MAITKTGANYLEKVSFKKEADVFNIVGSADKYLGRAGKSIFKNLGRLGKPAVKGTEATAEGAIKGTGSIGKMIKDHPKASIYGGLGALGAGYGVSRPSINKNLHHVDPNYNTTQQGIFGVKYNQPQKEKFYNKQNLLY